MRSCLSTSIASAALLVGIAGPASAQFTINPTYDASITGAPNAAAIEAAIQQSMSRYSIYSDNFAANVLFRYANTDPDGSALGSNTLAESNYTVYFRPWNLYMNALVADRTTANDNTAIAHFPASPISTNMVFSSADGRAVGFSTPGVMSADGQIGTGGHYDGIVTLNSNFGSQFDFFRGDGILSNQYDALRSFQHEIDEVLGLGSILGTGLSTATYFRPQDLFRYSAPGARSLTASSNASSYFSIDGGATHIVGFNQNGNGDYGDWLSPACGASVQYVQYAFTCEGTIADVSATSPEGINLDVIGYDLTTATPEPASAALFATGLFVLIAVLPSRMRRRNHRREVATAA